MVVTSTFKLMLPDASILSGLWAGLATLFLAGVGLYLPPICRRLFGNGAGLFPCRQNARRRWLRRARYLRADGARSVGKNALHRRSACFETRLGFAMALLSMTVWVDSIVTERHPEEPAQRASRRTRSTNPSSLSIDAQPRGEARFLRYRIVPAPFTVPGQ